MIKYILLLLWVTVIRADAIKNIVVFGDSYSDVGNKQRLTNGPLWHEHVAVGWEASLYSFAFSGAVCNNKMYSKEDTFIPSVVDQVEMYYKQNMSLKAEETAVVFWVGVNDIYKIFKESKLENQQKGLLKVVDCISTNIRNVRRVFSVNKFIVFGVPPLEKMPYYATTVIAASREKAANDLNYQLTKEIDKMNKHLQNIELDMVDIHQLLNDIAEQPELFHMKNTQDAYWDTCQGRCSDDIDTYMWWDKTHLTGGVHRMIANSILMAGSLAPETSLKEGVDIKGLLTAYQSPIYKPLRNTGEIERMIQSLNQAQTSDQQQHEAFIEEEEYRNDKIEDKSYVFYGITATVIMSVGFILFIKTTRRKATHLLKNDNRAKFVALRNLDSQV